MLIAVSGSQGSGKSTILSRLANLGFPTVTRKTSRSILSDWGVTLQQVNSDPELTTKFQDELIERKLRDEQQVVESSNLWFTERTFIDFLVYATISLGKDNKFSSWLDAYGKKCISNQLTYSQVFYLSAGHFSVEKDGIRGHNMFYSSMVDSTMENFYRSFHPNQGNFLVINTPSFNERINIIMDEVKKLDKEKND